MDWIEPCRVDKGISLKPARDSIIQCHGSDESGSSLLSMSESNLKVLNCVVWELFSKQWKRYWGNEWMWEKPASMVQRIEWNEQNAILKVWFRLLLVWLAAFCSTVSVAVSAAACGLLLVYCRCCSYCVSCAAFLPFNFRLSFIAIVRVTACYFFGLQQLGQCLSYVASGTW